LYNNDDNADTGNAPTLNICFENTIIIEKNDNKMDIDTSSNGGSIDTYPIIINEDKEEKPLQMLDPSEKVELPCTDRPTLFSIMIADTIGAEWSWILMKVFFDPGSSTTFIHC
jgi:hypothetical protein